MAHPVQAAAHAAPAHAAAQAPSHRIYAKFGKRLLDILLVLAAAPFVVPLILSLAFVVWCNGGRPFYSQDRIGYGGRVYRMWKLRSMIHNAEEALERHLKANPEARAEWNANQKLKHDMRITPFGHILRRTSLDELPQLWNVFTGDMSLVGPRPMMPEQASLYPCTRYYDMRPGITGFWQVSARNSVDCTFRSRAIFDAQYHSAMSFMTDIKMLVATVGVVLKAKGR